MKNQTFLPKLTVPVKRLAVNAGQKHTPAVDASWITGDNNWGTPFAAVDASWITGDNNWGTPFAGEGAE
jgi:hypothetical protein